MTGIRHALVPLALVLVVTIAGCSGAVNTDASGQSSSDGSSAPTSAPSQQSQCPNGQISPNTDLQSLSPAAPNGWEKLDEESGVLSSQSDGKSLTIKWRSVNYTSSDGIRYELSMSHISSENMASEDLDLFTNVSATTGAGVKSGSFVLDVSASWEEYNKTTKEQYRKDTLTLLSAVPCVNDGGAKTGTPYHFEVPEITTPDFGNESIELGSISTPNPKDAEMSITNFQIETEPFVGEKRSIKRLQFDLENTGDVPVHVSNVDVVVNGESHSMFFLKEVSTGTIAHVDSEESPIMATNLKEGSNDVVIKVYSQETVVAELQKTVTIETSVSTG